jgi:hypothetical protein
MRSASELHPQLEALRNEAVRLVIKDGFRGLSAAEDLRLITLDEEQEQLFPEIAQVLGWDWAAMTAPGKLRYATGNQTEVMLRELQKLVKMTLADVSRQPMIIGTTSLTDPTGHKGYKTEYVQASALVRIADTLETQTDFLLSRSAGAAVETPKRFGILVQTRHLAAFLAFIKPAHPSDVTVGEYMLSTEITVLSHHPGAGGDGPGPDLTHVQIEHKRADNLYYLGHYWARREMALEAREGGPAHGA